MRKLGGVLALSAVLLLFVAASPAIAQEPALPASGLTGEPPTPDSSGQVKDSRRLDSGWPPVLVGAALLVGGTAVGATVVMMRRARAALRSTNGGR